jgi:sphingomyelin phosphodiesterase
MCANLIGLCQYPAVRPHTLSFPSSKPKDIILPSSGKSPIKVVHFSDTHVDLSYETGSSYECSKPICCRVFEDKDAPGITKTPCGPFGNPKCDPPQALQESMHAAIAEINPAFSIYTGDVVSHDVWLVDQAEALESFNSTYGQMEKSLGMVYAAIGNHDSAPLNLFPPNTIQDGNNQWAYNALAEDWVALTGISSVQSADEYGSYSAIHPNSNLRIISYNSIFYYKFNFYMYQEPMETDPNGQLQWLIKELQAAEDAGQRAWLISHIPSGVADHFHDYSQYFDQIVQRYEATIAGMFYGHTHMDEFQIAYSNYNNRNWETATAMGYIAPAMTPTEGPPSFRVYEIDPDTFGVLDYTQYIANISDPTYQTKPKWIPYYSAKADYGSKLSPPVTDPKAELTPAFWHNVTVAMEHDQSVFQDFWARRVRGYNVTGCTGDCITAEICTLRAADAQYNCVKPKPGLNFSKRDGETVALPEEESQSHCDHAGLASLLGKIAYRARVAKKLEDA